MQILVPVGLMLGSVVAKARFECTIVFFYFGRSSGVVARRLRVRCVQRRADDVEEIRDDLQSVVRQ